MFTFNFVNYFILRQKQENLHEISWSLLLEIASNNDNLHILCVLEGRTPLNKPPIEIHVKPVYFPCVFNPQVTIFWTF